MLEKSDKIAEEVYATVLQARQDLEEIAASFKQTIELTRSGDGLIAALLSDRKMKHKLNNMLDQGIYLLEHPIMFILKGGYKERKEPPDIEEEEEENNSRPDEESSPSPTPKPTAKPSPKSTKSAEPTRTRTADRPAPGPKRTRR
ncbi:MAG: hypothetical protein U5N86_01060 [Planctomycetota bacterium]|nr:hypothetical protein [Planctomycetota bacterium]